VSTNDEARVQDPLAIASDVSLTMAGSPDVPGMLTAIARRIAEALGVWECDLYEYLPETDEFAAVALWARELSEADRAFVGVSRSIEVLPSYRLLFGERAALEYQLDDPSLGAVERAAMERWGERSVLNMPLIFQDTVVGAVMLIEKRARRSFGADDRGLLESLAVPAAVAVQNGRLLRREAEQNRRLQALLAASRAMTSAHGLDELLTVIARKGREALDADECAIDTYDPEAGTITIRAYQTRLPRSDDARYLGFQYSVEDYPADKAILLEGEIVEERVSDPDLEERNRRWMIENGESSCLNVPLVYEGRPIGLLSFLELEEERRYTAAARELAAALGEQAAAAIHNAELVEQTERQNRRLNLLLQAIRAISTELDLDDVLAIVARSAAEALNAEQCQIQEYDPRAGTVTPVAFWQRHTDRPEPDSLHKAFPLDTECGERLCLEKRTAVQELFSDPQLEPSVRASMTAYGDLSYLNIPLMLGDQALGVMALVETEYERRWSDEDVALGHALGEQVAVAIERARLYKRIQDQAITDGLTGLYNHRHFYERLEREVVRAQRYGTPVSLLMLDLDDFKAYNDLHGHLAGDAVLREVAAILRAELRAKLDVAARYGGEEFAVILPNTPLSVAVAADAAAAAATESLFGGEDVAGRPDGDPLPPGHNGGAEAVGERIRRRIAQCAFGADPASVPAVTCSVGVAVFPQRTTSAEELVSNADAARYKAKRGGKNRVETYG
jgi:GGDEF domain-containing protein